MPFSFKPPENNPGFWAVPSQQAGSSWGWQQRAAWLPGGHRAASCPLAQHQARRAGQAGRQADRPHLLAPRTVAPASSKLSNAHCHLACRSSCRWRLRWCWRGRVMGGRPSAPRSWHSDMPTSSLSPSSSGKCLDCPPTHILGPA